MVNSDDFIKRLEIILDYYALSASGFADKIGVQRSSLSHLLSGRNKPSLDFILKIIEIFPEVDLYWIINGVGNFPKSDVIAVSEIEKKAIAPTPILENKAVGNLFSTELNFENEEIKTEKLIDNFDQNKINNEVKRNSKIERIVIFYVDGTFSEHVPK